MQQLKDVIKTKIDDEFLIINFDHPLSDEQINQFSDFTHSKIKVIDKSCELDMDEDIRSQGYRLYMTIRYFAPEGVVIGIIPPGIGILALFLMYYVDRLGISPDPHWLWVQSDGSLFSHYFFKKLSYRRGRR